MKVQEQVGWGWAGSQWVKNQWMTYRHTYADWKKLWEKQGGKCAICKEDLAHPLEKEMKKGLKPETDHLHREGKQCETGDVRGLLCKRCNGLLGKIRDNIDILANALAYLKQQGEL